MVALVETMAYAGAVPWHGLGERVADNLSPQEMLVAAGLDWEVALAPTFAELNGEMVEMQRKALYRKSDYVVFDTVGEGWNPCQNWQAADLFSEYVETGGMKMHTAGSLNGGRNVWFLAKVDNSFEVFKGDRIDAFFLFSSPHSYGHSINVRFTPIRVVCNNTLTLSLGTKSVNEVKLSHGKAFNPEEVKKTLAIATDKLGQYEEMAVFLGSKRYNDDSLTEYMQATFPVSGKAPKKEVSKNAKLAQENVLTQPGAEFAQGSWWQAYNSVTHMVDHQIGRTADNRMQSAWFGTGATLKSNALKRALEFAEAS
jgi:phage/plasmid-like protein (TIGR03299 family)